MMRAVKGVAIPVLFVAFGCGGRYSDEAAYTSAGRASVQPDGPGPSMGGAGNDVPSAAGAPSAGGAPNAAGATSAGAPGAGAPSGCQSPNTPPSGVTSTPQNVSGNYQLVTCGEITRCTQVGTMGMSTPLSDTLELSVVQKPDDLMHGTVELSGTGELLLDSRPFDAVFNERSFSVTLSGPISTVCSQEYDFTFAYDFDGRGPRQFNLDFERSPTCNGNNGSEHCFGNVHGTFGAATKVISE